jgi:hypothetical protein
MVTVLNKLARTVNAQDAMITSIAGTMFAAGSGAAGSDAGFTCEDDDEVGALPVTMTTDTVTSSVSGKLVAVLPAKL